MKINQPAAISGLITDTFKVEAAGMHSIYVKSTVLQGSGLVITVSQSGSISVSASTPPTAASQEAVDINHTFNCAIGDILTVTTTSSTTVDQPPSMIQTTITLRQGL